MDTEWIKDLTLFGIEPNPGPGWRCKKCNCEHRQHRMLETCKKCGEKRTAESLRRRTACFEARKIEDVKVDDSLPVSKYVKRRQKVRAFIVKLRLQVSAPGGKCMICKKRPSREIDHLRPDLKQLTFGSSSMSLIKVREEIERNTIKRKILLQGLCSACHLRKSQKDCRSKRKNEYKSPRKRDHFIRTYINTYKIGQKTCKYENCDTRNEVCNARNVSTFDLDHLHAKKCTCDLCKANPSLRKSFQISNYVCGVMTVRGKSEETMKAELDAELAKTRLMHRDCHLQHTATQRKQGKRKAEACDKKESKGPAKKRQRR
jgi:hypothetical protein